jgi:hypothetical protein
MDRLIPVWFPEGKRLGKTEYVAKNPERQDQNLGSFSICLERGFGYDFASKKWYGPIDLFAIAHGLSTSEAICRLRSQLKADDIEKLKTQLSPRNSDRKADTTTGIQVLPTRDFDTERLRHHVFGKPCVVFTYRNTQGKLLGYVCRFNLNLDGRSVKRLLPFTFFERKGKTGWHWSEQGWAGRKPIYRAEKLGANPQTQVLITEGESTCDAAQRLFPEFTCITWRGGVHCVDKVDWSSLLARAQVTVWPDCDEAGLDAARNIKKLVPRTIIVRPPPWKESGWDLADAEQDGVSPDVLRRYLLENQIS